MTRYTDIEFGDGSELGYFDLELDDSGDFKKTDSFNTAILLSIFGSNRRATATEVPESYAREGWIGDFNRPVELGSKLWLLYQTRLTNNTVNRARDYLEQALAWLVDFGYLQQIIVTTRRDIDASAVVANIRMVRFDSSVESRNYTLWENTGGFGYTDRP